jgi:hypothetical protein
MQCSACVHVRIATITIKVYAHPLPCMMTATMPSLRMHAYACLVVVAGVVVAKGGHKRVWWWRRGVTNATCVMGLHVKACDGTTALTSRSVTVLVPVTRLRCILVLVVWPDPLSPHANFTWHGAFPSFVSVNVFALAPPTRFSAAIESGWEE